MAADQGTQDLQRFTTRPRWGGGAALALGLLGWAVLAYYGFLAVYSELLRHGQARAISTGFYASLGLLAMLLLLIVLGVMLLRKVPVEVHLTEGGLSVRRGRQSWQVAYDQVGRITRADTVTYLLFFPRRSASISLHLPQGILRLNNTLRDFDRLAGEIEAQVYPRLGARMQQELAAGRTLDFGPLAVNRSGWSCPQGSFPWGITRGAALHSGKLILEVAGEQGARHIRLRASDLPDLPLLLSLFEMHAPAGRSNLD